MIVKTNIASKLDSTEAKSEYDENAKYLLAEKVFLAEILMNVVSEFAGMKREEVELLIETPIVSKVSVQPGETNMPTIQGMNVEDAIPNEGKIVFDIRFVAHAPNGDQLIKLLLDVELQKKYQVGYDLVIRAFFYAARMLSAELSTEFVTPNYNDIKKVYSIFICMDSPDYAQNTTTRYHIVQEDLVGNFPQNKSRFDLLEVIMICLPNKIGKKEEEHPLHRLLGVTLSNKLTSEEKKKILEQEFHIPMTQEIDRRLVSMCNLSELIEEQAMEQGILQGREEGILQGREEGILQGREEGILQGIIASIELCKEFGASIEETEHKLIEKYSLTKEEANALVKQNW